PPLPAAAEKNGVLHALFANRIQRNGRFIKGRRHSKSGKRSARMEKDIANGEVNEMTLEVGGKVPNFTLPSAEGKVKLSDYRGKLVVLYFYPQDLTPTCTQQACDFRDAHMELLANDAVVLGVSTDE